MSSKLTLSLMLALPLLLGGCLNEPIGARDAGFGEAVKYDTAIQIINPEPVYAAGATQPGSNGEVAQKAVERYRTDKVRPVQTQTTMGTSGSGSGSGSGPR